MIVLKEPPVKDLKLLAGALFSKLLSDCTYELVERGHALRQR
jgi:hypothetical protein